MISFLKRPTIDIVDLGIKTQENKISSKSPKIAYIANATVQRFLKESELIRVRDRLTEELYINVWKAKIFGLPLRLHYIHDGCFSSKSNQQYFADSICASILKYRYDIDRWAPNSPNQELNNFCFSLIMKGIDNLYCQSLTSNLDEFIDVKYIQPDEISAFIYDKSY